MVENKRKTEQIGENLQESGTWLRKLRFFECNCGLTGWYSLRTLASLLGRSKRTINRWHAAGMGPNSKGYKNLRIFRAVEIYYWLSRQRSEVLYDPLCVRREIGYKVFRAEQAAPRIGWSVSELTEAVGAQHPKIPIYYLIENRPYFFHRDLEDFQAGRERTSLQVYGRRSEEEALAATSLWVESQKIASGCSYAATCMRWSEKSG